MSLDSNRVMDLDQTNCPFQCTHVESINLLPFSTGNPHHVIPGQYQYTSIQSLLDAEDTMFSKIAGRLLRITQCHEVGGKTPGYTYSLKIKKERKAIFGSFCLLFFQDLVDTGTVFYVRVHNNTNHFL